MPAGRPKIYDTYYQGKVIREWMRNGLICREGESYKDIYSFYISSQNCNLCSIKFNDKIHNEKRCMDHDHETRFFRQVLCMKCNKHFDRGIHKNNKTGHMFISPITTKRKSGEIYYRFQYQRKGFKSKSSVSLTKMIAYSFINLLKKPI